MEYKSQLKYEEYRKPSFIIIGSQKCGTTSLYYNLIKHPCIRPSQKKEIHFFDENENYNKGLNWYLSFFHPVGLFNDMITGEASPRYLYLPYVPERVYQAFPDIKLIVLLRNPVNRAYSQYYHDVRQNRITDSFEVAVQKATLIDKNRTEISINESGFSIKYRQFSYLARGIYIEQLKRWLNFFSSEQLLILKSEEFFNNQRQVMDKVFSFLGIQSISVRQYGKKNCFSYPPMKNETRKYLIDYYRPVNHQLYDFLGTDFGWESINL